MSQSELPLHLTWGEAGPCRLSEQLCGRGKTQPRFPITPPSGEQGPMAQRAISVPGHPSSPISRPRHL